MNEIPWIKQGRIFHLEPSSGRSTHTQVPTPLVCDGYIRVYYAGRSHGMSFPAFFDLSFDLKTILRIQEKPIMELGLPGMFDSDGIMPGCVLKHPHSGELLMYYTGWNEKSKTARYHNTIGVAVSHDGGETFERKFPGPIFDRATDYPGLSVTPFILFNNWFRMWYISGKSWHKIGDKYEPVYVIKHAESFDGIEWRRLNEICIKQNHPLEAFSNPTVIYKDCLYHLWYCYRDSKDYRGGKGSYRIGYGTSDDGENFARLDNRAGLSLGEPGEFDSTMQCYPYVIKLGGKMVMFYNGNDFGQTGIGIATWG